VIHHSARHWSQSFSVSVNYHVEYAVPSLPFRGEELWTSSIPLCCSSGDIMVAGSRSTLQSGFRVMGSGNLFDITCRNQMVEPLRGFLLAHRVFRDECARVNISPLCWGSNEWGRGAFGGASGCRERAVVPKSLRGRADGIIAEDEGIF
jgi:hypothetical protein